MIANSDAFVVLPGGLGTIDEWISTISDFMVKEQVDPTVDKPIFALNLDGMHNGMVQQLNETDTSVYARGKRVVRSLIFTDTESLAQTLHELQVNA